MVCGFEELYQTGGIREVARMAFDFATFLSRFFTPVTFYQVVSRK